MKASDNPFPGILIRESANDGSDFSNPAADYRVAFLGEDGLWHVKDSAGTVSDPFSGSGSVATDAIWDAAGDLVQGTGANTAARLAAGTLGYHLRSGGAATAVSWASRELDYVEITSAVNLTATTEGTAHTIITGTSQAYAAEPIIIEVYSPRIDTSTTNGSAVIVLLFDGGTVLGRIATLINPTGVAGVKAAVHGVQRITPTAATHQYIIKAYASASTGVFGAGAGGTGTDMAAFLRITRAI